MKFESNTNSLFETEPGYNILHHSYAQLGPAHWQMPFLGQDDEYSAHKIPFSGHAIKKS